MTSAAEQKSKKLLLVDLDGVLITNSWPENQANQICYLLHEDNIGQEIANNGQTIAVLTHRHKAEAEQILEFLRIDSTHIAQCYSAQELWFCAKKYHPILSTIIGGMKKSLILPLIKAELGYHPQDIAMIDDRLDVLSDMSNHGVGLTILAPFQGNSSQNTSQTITFSFSEALTVFNKWSNSKSANKPQHISLKERVVANSTLRLHSHALVLHRRDLFSVLRKISRVLRRFIFH